MFNLLNAALSLIPPVTVVWRRATGRTQNALGQWVTAYDNPVDLTCSFQPIEKAKYEALGLDMNKHYYVLYGSAALVAVERGTSGDIVDYGGKRYQFEDSIDWFAYNGWKGIVCVEIGDTPAPPPPPPEPEP